ncbi:MAG: hypothetical protein IJX02_02900, partial [Clostridia bacterium]|nr:hypothetical protein [Clostridia bacterium]
MKKPIAILTILVMLFTLSVIFTSCGDECEHTYDNACDATCNECGEERTITHSPSEDDGDCTTEITCSVCKAITTPARDSHTGGTATCTEKASCTVCSTSYGTVDANNHIDGNADHRCDRNCGKTDIGTHADSTEDNDHVCDYGCGAILEEHKGGTEQTCLGYKCDICGEWYGETLLHNYTYTANANNITESCDQGCGHSVTVTLNAPADLVYSGEAKVSTLSGTGGLVTAVPTITYSGDCTSVGRHSASITLGGATVSLDFEITMATPNVTAPTANTLTYNGEAQALVSAGSTDFGTMLYSLTEDGEYTTSIPTGTNAGSYTVYYYVQGNENVSDSTVASVTVEIAKAVASITAAPTPNTLTYIGEAQYLISAGEADIGRMVYSLTEDGEYTTSIPQGTNAGDYTVWYYVQGDANHNDSAKDS